MPKIEFPFIVDVQTLKQVAFPCKLRAGNKNYFYVTFKLSDDWIELESLKAIFKTGTSKIVRDISWNGSKFECQIPNEMMRNQGCFTIGITGGDTLVTNEVAICVYEGAYIPEEDTPLNTAILGKCILGQMILGYGG